MMIFVAERFKNSQVHGKCFSLKHFSDNRLDIFRISPLARERVSST